MSFEITRQAGGTDVNVTLRRVEREIDSELARIVLLGAQYLAGEMRRQITTLLAKRPTGSLARSVTVFLTENGGKIAGAGVAPDQPYARIQDQGGTIHARDKLLAVPLGNHVPIGKAPRDFAPGELTLIPGKGGKPSILARVSARKVTPMFSLRRSVRIPGVGYIEKTITAGAAGVEKITEKALEDALARGAKE